jgi:hypothetical protein
MKLFGIYYGVWKESVSLSVSSQKKVEILKIIILWSQKNVVFSNLVTLNLSKTCLSN